MGCSLAMAGVNGSPLDCQNHPPQFNMMNLIDLPKRFRLPFGSFRLQKILGLLRISVFYPDSPFCCRPAAGKRFSMLRAHAAAEGLIWRDCGSFIQPRSLIQTVWMI